MKKNSQQQISIEEVLVRQVIALVETTADLICRDSGENILDVQAQLFETLEVNCATKKKLCEKGALKTTPKRRVGRARKP
jgi:hypothetical protein